MSCNMLMICFPHSRQAEIRGCSTLAAAGRRARPPVRASEIVTHSWRGAVCVGALGGGGCTSSAPRHSLTEKRITSNPSHTIPPVPKWLTPPQLFGTADLKWGGSTIRDPV